MAQKSLNFSCLFVKLNLSLSDAILGGFFAWQQSFNHSLYVCVCVCLTNPLLIFSIVLCLTRAVRMIGRKIGCYWHYYSCKWANVSLGYQKSPVKTLRNIEVLQFPFFTPEFWRFAIKEAFIFIPFRAPEWYKKWRHYSIDWSNLKKVHFTSFPFHVL